MFRDCSLCLYRQLFAGLRTLIVRCLIDALLSISLDKALEYQFIMSQASSVMVFGKLSEDACLCK